MVQYWGKYPNFAPLRFQHMIVTGATGFLGSYVVAALLKAGHTVKGTKRQNSNTSAFDAVLKLELGPQYTELISHFTWHTIDVLDILALDDLLNEGDTVFHCAARVAFNKSQVEEMMAINVQGTANVVNACLKKKARKLIHVSSTAALGRNSKGSEISEETEWDEGGHNTQYAISKHLSELEVWRGIEEGLDAAIVNPGIILGYGDGEQGSCRLFRNIANGFSLYTKSINGFVGVKDVATVILQLANQSISAERFLLISENLTYQTVFNTMADTMGVKRPTLEMKKSYRRVLVFLSHILQFFHSRSSITPETVRTSLSDNVYINIKAKTLLHFEFTPIKAVIEGVGKLYLK